MAKYKENEKLTRQLINLRLNGFIQVPSIRYRISVVRTTASHLNSTTEFTFAVSDEGDFSIVKRVK